MYEYHQWKTGAVQRPVRQEKIEALVFSVTIVKVLNHSIRQPAFGLHGGFFVVANEGLYITDHAAGGVSARQVAGFE